MRMLFRCAGVVGIAALLWLGGCDSPKDLEAKYIANGKALYESGDFAKAAVEFRNALQIQPANLEPQYYLGLIAEKQEKRDAAAAAFQKVADADPKNFDANRKAGQYALLGANVDGTKRYAKQILANAPGKPEGHTLMAAALLLEGKLPEAEKEARAALALDPKNVDALVVLAGRQARGGALDAALATVEQGLADNAKSTDLLLVKLKILFDQKKTTEVVTVLRQMHEIDPKNPNYVIDLANQLAMIDQLGEAETIFKQALEANADNDALIAAYAGFLVQKRSLDEAIKQIKVLAEQTKLAPKYVLLLEQLYVQAKKFDEATALMHDLEQNGANANDRLRAKVELARLTALQGKPDEALVQIEAILKEDAENEPALLLRSGLELNAEKYDAVIADAKSVLHKDLNSVAALVLLSKAYEATGDTVLAIDALRNITRLAPNDVDARLRLASLLAAKAPDEALQHLDVAIAMRPAAPELKVQKAEFLVRTGAPDKGEALAETLIKDPATAAVGHRIVAMSAMARSDFATAIAELQLAADGGEPFEKTGPMLVAAYMRSGKPELAEKLLSERIAKDAGDAKSMVLLAAVRMQAGKADEAEKLLRQAIAAKPDSTEPYISLVQLLSQQRKSDEVVKVSEAASQKFPNDRSMGLVAAIAYDTSGNFQAAKAGYEKILAKWPDDMVAANNLAALIADVWPTDAQLLDRARQLTEKFRGSDNAVLLDTLGWVLVRQGNFDDAAILLARATSLLPDNQQMQFHYGMALKGKGLTTKAQAAFSLALAGKPDYRGQDEAHQVSSTLK
ncbi:tetratricopeptide repeat protein [Dongia sp.]|uniref:tetratricopeptide repeat protein n=1 Tax=Dongia sp. TaxID=1977262 RepID=UPI00375350EA